MVFQTLNRLKWKGLLGKAEIVIIHRGGERGVRHIPGSSITELRKSYFYYMPEPLGQNRAPSRETYIPLHRVIEIRLDGKTVWKRSTCRSHPRQVR